jgi:hypoxanthine phosphoribosyltransferase
MKEIRILDKSFREMIPESVITKRIGELAVMINNDYSGKEVIFLGILNGAFLFAAELYKRTDIMSRISFVKLASYQGTKTTGSVKELIGWNEDIKGKEIVIVEDVVDTGHTLDRIIDELRIRKAGKVRIAALLYKPNSFLYKDNIKLDYVGFEIDNNFVVGYGLDYDGYGRNLPAIYTLI